MDKPGPRVDSDSILFDERHGGPGSDKISGEQRRQLIELSTTELDQMSWRRRLAAFAMLAVVFCALLATCRQLTAAHRPPIEVLLESLNSYCCFDANTLVEVRSTLWMFSNVMEWATIVSSLTMMSIILRFSLGVRVQEYEWWEWVTSDRGVAAGSIYSDEHSKPSVVAEKGRASRSSLVIAKLLTFFAGVLVVTWWNYALSSNERFTLQLRAMLVTPEDLVRVGVSNSAIGLANTGQLESLLWHAFFNHCASSVMLVLLIAVFLTTSQSLLAPRRAPSVSAPTQNGIFGPPDLKSPTQLLDGLATTLEWLVKKLRQ